MTDPELVAKKLALIETYAVEHRLGDLLAFVAVVRRRLMGARD